MRSYINIILCVAALLLFSDALASAEEIEGARKVDEKKGALSIVLRDIDLLWIMDCGDIGTCISQELSPGSTITVLSGNESNLCKLQAGTERTFMPDPEEDNIEVVKIENLTCPPGTGNVTGIVGEVHKYEKKEYKRISDAEEIAGIDKEIWESGFLEKYIHSGYSQDDISKNFRGLPEVYSYPFLNADIFFARYGYFSPLVLVMNGEYSVLTPYVHYCCEDGDAFVINDSYYFEYSVCGDSKGVYEGGHCENVRYEITTMNSHEKK